MREFLKLRRGSEQIDIINFLSNKSAGACSFIYQGTSIRKQRKDLLDLRGKLPSVTNV